MDNPGLRHYVSTTPVSGTTKDQYLKVLSRRHANTPAPQAAGYGVVPPEPATITEDETQPPSLSGRPNTSGPSSSNGAGSTSVPMGTPMGALNTGNSAQVPLRTDPKAKGVTPTNTAQQAMNMQQMQMQQQRQRQIQQEQAKGGGASGANPAWLQAQQNLNARMQARRAHPLHQAAQIDLPDGEFIYRVDAMPKFSPGTAGDEDLADENNPHTIWPDDEPHDNSDESHDLNDAEPSGTNLDGTPEDEEEEPQAARSNQHEARVAMLSDDPDNIRMKDYQGETGNVNHITRNEWGNFPVEWFEGHPGANGEDQAGHPRYQGQDWEDFKNDIAANGIKRPIFVSVDHSKSGTRKPLVQIVEGNNRLQAARELGMPRVPAEVRYFGRAEDEGTLGQRYQWRKQLFPKQATLLDSPVMKWQEDPAELGLRHFFDTELEAPRGAASTAQPMIKFKHVVMPDTPDSEIRMADPSEYEPSIDGCETCYLKDDNPFTTRWFHEHAPEKFDHPFKPFTMEPGQRFSFVNPGLVRHAEYDPEEDPVFPYRRSVNPDDTADLDNPQTGDDRFRSEPPIDEAPDHGLMDRVFGPSTGDETPEEERAARAHEQFFDMAKGLPKAHREIQAPDLSELGLDRLDAEDVAERTNNMLNRVLPNDVPGADGLTQAQRSGIDNYVKGLKQTHKEKVQALLDDWLARGGVKTKEPRPVERFSARYGLQRIVPMEGNMFPENTEPIYPVGKCEGCGTKLYDSKGNSGDPRGELGDHTVGAINARDYDATDVPKEERDGTRRMHGPSALICPNCENDSDRYHRILDRYLGHKAGDKTGGGYWGVPFGSPPGTRREFIPSTYSKDRKGKWHNPGEQVGNCPECDKGITGFSREANWAEMVRA